MRKFPDLRYCHLNWKKILIGQNIHAPPISAFWYLKVYLMTFRKEEDSEAIVSTIPVRHFE